MPEREWRAHRRRDHRPLEIALGKVAVRSAAYAVQLGDDGAHRAQGGKGLSKVTVGDSSGVEQVLAQRQCFLGLLPFDVGKLGTLGLFDLLLGSADRRSL